jgi:hypothetical protein
MRSERGGITLMAAVLLPVSLAFMGLALDVGYLYSHRAQMRTAADAAALAAAMEVKRANAANSDEAADAAAEANGFADVEVAVNHPPLEGPSAGDSNFVEVILEEQASTFFMGIFSADSTRVRARAVAGLFSAMDASVVLLNPTVPQSLWIASDSHLDAAMSVLVNSNHERAVSVVLGSTLTAESISVVGGYEGAGYTPLPETGQAPMADPLGDLNPPSVGACNFTNFQVLAGTTATLNPGVYCGGIKVWSGATANLNSGVYVMNNGGVQVFSTSTLKGNGVAIYNTGATPGKFQFLSGSTVQLTAPSSGPMAGIVMFQDRAAPATLTADIASGTNTYFEGTLYFPNHDIRVMSASSINAGASWTFIVARTMQILSGSTLTLGADLGEGAPPTPFKKVRLSE